MNKGTQKGSVFAVVLSILALIGSLVAIGIAVGISKSGQTSYATILTSDDSNNSEDEPDEDEPSANEEVNNEDEEPSNDADAEPSNEIDDSPEDNSTEDAASEDQGSNDEQNNEVQDSDLEDDSADSDASQEEDSQDETEDSSDDSSDESETEVEVEFEDEDVFEIDDSDIPDGITVDSGDISEIEFEFEDGRLVVKVTGTLDGETITQVADAEQNEIRLIAQDGQVITITISDTGKLVLVDGNIVNNTEFSAEVEGTLLFDKENGTIWYDSGDGTLVEATQLPSEVAQKLLEMNENVDSLESVFILESDGTSLEYKIQAKNEVKFLGLIPFEVSLKVTASATSSLVTLDLPWYLTNRFTRFFLSGERS